MSAHGDDVYYVVRLDVGRLPSICDFVTDSASISISKF